MALKKDSTAKLVAPVIQGTVKDVRWNADADCKEMLVEWTDGDVTQSRWFAESQLEEVV